MYTFFENFKLALQAIWSKKTRSFLTMLGVIIGVFSIVLLVAIGQGVKQEVTGQIEGLGSNLLFVVPGNFSDETAAPSASGFIGNSSLTEEDVAALASINGVELAVPIAIMGLPVTTERPVAPKDVAVPPSAENQAGTVQQSATSIMLIGSNADVKTAFAGQMTQGEEYGHMFTEEEYESAERVAVGYSGATDALFPEKDIQEVLGETIYIGKHEFEIVGLLEAEQTEGLFSSTDMTKVIVIPFTTAKEISETLAINRIVLSVADSSNIETVKKAAYNSLLNTHEGVEDFDVLTQEDLLDVFNEILGIITTMLGGIAAISLLVGGIGVMNIMLVSVTERTKEIGLRKAIGASGFDILTQFIIEAILLTLIGGIIGVLLAQGGASIMDAQFGFAPVISFDIILLAFGFTVIVGIFFGVAPAIRASRLDPIDALKYE